MEITEGQSSHFIINNKSLLRHEKKKSGHTPKKPNALKRTISIVHLTKRLSINSLNKKSQQIINNLSKMPSKDKHLITAEIKCFMMAKHSHDSHLIDERLTSSAMEKIRRSERLEDSYSFRYTSFVMFADTIVRKVGDSESLVASFEACMGEKYPPTVKMMLIYLGSYLYSLNSHYEEAEHYCQKLFDEIVKYKVEEFFIIYLLMQTKLKTNLCQWHEAVNYLTKLVYFSWMYNQHDLQIWCYFELSRCFFFLQLTQESEVFKIKSETNSIQPKRSIYRQVSISNLIFEIEAIWEGQLNFKYDHQIEYSRLLVPQSHKYGLNEYISDQRRLKTNIKGIIEECKIRHVGNLLSRIGGISMNNIHKQNPGYSSNKTTTGSNKQNPTMAASLSALTHSSSYQSLQNPHAVKSGNNFLLTHQSYNKNMNMYFRKRRTKNDNAGKVYYTIENSVKNWGALKEMLRNVFLEMNYFVKSASGAAMDAD